jgi:hypothetical protein
VLLVAAYWLHRVSFPKFVYPKAARSPEQLAPSMPDYRDLATGRTQSPRTSVSAPTGDGPKSQVRTVEIRGTLADAKGAPVPLATVEAFIHDAARTLTRRTVETDASGSFRLDCPEYSQLTLTAQLRGHGRAFYPMQVSDAAGTVNAVALTLRSAIEFEGTLAHADGSPAAAVVLRFHPVSTKSLDARGEALVLALINPSDRDWVEQCRSAGYLTDCEARTDERGQFRADSLIASTMYSVEVLREGQPRVLIDFFSRVPGSGVRLTLPR